MHVGEPHRFHDGGTDTEPPDRDREPMIVLERDIDDGVERFRMLRRIGYVDRRLGDLLVPADLGAFRTDLTSVPWLFTWLVPRTGEHLPAAILHDALLRPSSYISVEGHRIGRVEADRIFRDAMGDSDTGIVRRWLVWSAVTLETIRRGPREWSPVRRWRHRLVAGGSLLLIALLGAVATLDLFDVVAWLPWMGDRAWSVELLTGLVMAVAVPVLLGLAWGELRIAGTVVGVTFALLLHVTVVLLLLTLLYQLSERVAGRFSR